MLSVYAAEMIDESLFWKTTFRLTVSVEYDMSKSSETVTSERTPSLSWYRSEPTWLSSRLTVAYVASTALTRSPWNQMLEWLTTMFSALTGL